MSYIDKITDKDSGESRIISPAADAVRVDNENYEGSDLDEVLDEIAEAIEDAGSGGYTPPQGGIPKTDLAPSVQQTLDDVADKVDKVPGKGLSTNDYTDAEKTKLQNLPTADGLTQQLSSKANAADVSGVIEDNVSVEQPANPDGTFTIHVGDNDYTVNLNHTHPNMCKLVVCEESGLPSTYDDDTIYAVTDNGEIGKLIIRGMEFAGGGVPDTGEPIIKTPADGSTINLGTFDDLQSTPTKTITVWGKHLINGLTLAVTADSGFSLSKSAITKNEALAGEPVTISFDPSVLTTTTTTEAALAIKDSVTNDILSVCTVSVTFIDERITLNKALAIDGDSYQVVNPSGFCTIKVAVTKGHTYKMHYGFVANQTDEDFIALGYDANNSPVLVARFRYSYGGNTKKYRNAALGTTTTTTLEVTMKTSALDECYIYDTNSNEYLFRGSNADQSLDT